MGEQVKRDEDSPRMKRIEHLLVANRGEIAIRVFRTAHELGIRTVAIFSHEDRYALHRFKANEAYQIGKTGEPIQGYLDIPGIIELAKEQNIDAIHPGYGFLSENPQLAAACQQSGIIFVGPRQEQLEKLGDKVEARGIAARAGVPILPGSAQAVTDVKDAAKLAKELGYPILLKAAKGGGGRGMRVVSKPEDFASELEQAQREAQLAFGSSEVFIEKLILRPRHIEVQLLGDQHGNLVHLYERDCTVQRRHQKVVEIAPAFHLSRDLRDAMLDAAVAIGREVNYENAGTVEFLVDADTDKYYFIEVNPRIQVEHTVTEQVTGYDIVKCQILIAEGTPLSAPEIGINSQEDVRTRGYALQCRVTTEDPENQFLPDYGRISHYRSAGGMGVRLDGGTAFSGALVTPFYDSLLVKVTTSATRFPDAASRMERALQEFRIRGVKTNIPFLINLVTHPVFLDGKCTTRFIDETPELFQFAIRQDRATRLFTYLADITVNGHPLITDRPSQMGRDAAPVPKLDHTAPLPQGTRDIFLELGAEKFCQWILDQKRLLLTDTTFRDAHQSLLATRLRSYDMLQIAESYARLVPQLFSIEMWGGATFDTALRFLKECPWERLSQLRERIPNILFQMLLRASNAVGYSNYPDNLVRAFVREAAASGIDVFRIFDSLNWLPNMQVAIEEVQSTGAICEAAICYTGDVLNPARDKYNLKYYVDMARELERMGAHILAIKDMAGLCKPYAAKKLVKVLKEEIGLPIHFHTHDTTGVQAGSIINAAEVGLDIADAASAPMSGMTSQPNLDTIVEAFRFTDRETGIDPEALQSIANYWEVVREYYQPFEAGQKASTAEVYRHEMPGGQSTNLLQQAQALGLGKRWHEICKVYADVNQLFGDLVKVTPSSKAVGDMALFLVANDLSVEDVLDPKRDFAFPESVVDLISGRMGSPPGGFPAEVRERVLRDKAPVKGRPGESLPDADFVKTKNELAEHLETEPTQRQLISYLMFPKVFLEYVAHQERYSDTSVLPTPAFFYRLDPGEEVSLDIEKGKKLIVQFLAVGDPQPDGRRSVFFELNGQPRSVRVQDLTLEPAIGKHAKANPLDPREIGAPMPGMVVKVNISAGDSITKGQKLFTLEAMKMQTNLTADREGRVAEVLVQAGTQVETGDLAIRLE